MSEHHLRRKAAALLLAGRQLLLPRKRLPITKLDSVFSGLPGDFRVVVADVGSIGGLHQRWRVLRPHLITLNFDPLDKGRDGPQDRYFPFLLGAGEGRASLKVTRRPSMSSTLDPSQSFFAPFWNKPSDVEVMESFEAPVTSLDSIAANEGIWPDALKIDVQGGEGAVLEGAAQTLKRSVLLAEIECSFAARYEGQQTFDQVMARMRDSGFVLLDLRRLKRYRYRNGAQIVDASLGRGMRAGRLAFCDAIFIRDPDYIREQARAGGELGVGLTLKAIVLVLIYGKPDLAASLFDEVRAALPSATRDAFARFFQDLSKDGGTTQQLHHEFDAWSRRV